MKTLLLALLFLPLIVISAQAMSGAPPPLNTIGLVIFLALTYSLVILAFRRLKR